VTARAEARSHARRRALAEPPRRKRAYDKDMSWLSDVGQKLGIGDKEEAAGAVEATPGISATETQEDSLSRFTDAGPLPAVENQYKKPAPTASDKAFEQRRPEQEHQSRHAQKSAAAWSHQAWLTNPEDSGLRGEVETKNTPELTKEQIYDAISHVAPNLPHAFKVNMVGHVWVEQAGKKIVNWNYAGVEGGARATCLAWTSSDVPLDEVRAHPEKYRPWSTSVEKQLEQDPNRTTVIVMVQKPRPAYGTLNEATGAFVWEIQRRVQGLQQSNNEQHKALAELAAAGDPGAYAHIVGSSFTLEGVTDAKGRAKSLGAYNDHKNYEGDVLKSILATQGELANKAPQ
jgi:hypothetical protein